jgi:hypothetical protein
VKRNPNLFWATSHLWDQMRSMTWSFSYPKTKHGSSCLKISFFIFKQFAEPDPYKGPWDARHKPAELSESNLSVWSFRSGCQTIPILLNSITFWGQLNERASSQRTNFSEKYKRAIF